MAASARRTSFALVKGRRAACVGSGLCRKVIGSLSVFDLLVSRRERRWAVGRKEAFSRGQSAFNTTIFTNDLFVGHASCASSPSPTSPVAVVACTSPSVLCDACVSLSTTASASLSSLRSLSLLRLSAAQPSLDFVSDDSFLRLEAIERASGHSVQRQHHRPPVPRAHSSRLRTSPPSSASLSPRSCSTRTLPSYSLGTTNAASTPSSRM